MPKTPDNSRQILGVIGALAAAGALSLGIATSGGKEAVNKEKDATRGAVASALDKEDGGKAEMGTSSRIVGQQRIEPVEKDPEMTEEIVNDRELFQKALDGDYESAATLSSRIGMLYNEYLGDDMDFNRAEEMMKKWRKETGIDQETSNLFSKIKKFRELSESLALDQVKFGLNDSGETYERTEEEVEKYTEDTNIRMLVQLNDLNNPYNELTLNLFDLTKDELHDYVLQIIEFCESNTDEAVLPRAVLDDVRRKYSL